MISKLLISVVMFSFSLLCYAGKAENISACVNKANEFAGVRLDAFAVRYEGKVLTMSTAKWENAYCEVKIAEVYTLQINDKTYIYRGYAGKESFDLNTALQAKTNETISQMRSRISILELRASQVSVSLRKPSPDHKWLTRYVDEGVQKSIGNSNSQVAATATDNPQFSPQVNKISNTALSDSISVTSQPTTITAIDKSNELAQEVLIPRSMQGDRGQYYLLDYKKDGGIIKVLHKRVGVDSIGYTRSEINCQSKQIRVMGYSEISASAIQEKATSWHDLIQGSSKSDLANFVCAL